MLKSFFLFKIFPNNEIQSENKTENDSKINA